jgi:hypothetical protein
MVRGTRERRSGEDLAGMTTRLADVCPITRQPLFCPECGSSLNWRGECTDQRNRCPWWMNAEYGKGLSPFPSYGERAMTNCEYSDLLEAGIMAELEANKGA